MLFIGTFARILSALGLRASAKDDCQKLLNVVLPAARQLLENRGDFSPFGAALKTDGEIAYLAGYAECGDSSHAARKLMWDGFHAGARSGEYQATARAYHVGDVEHPSSGAKSYAVAVALDNRDQYSVVVFFPYEVANGKLIFADVFTVKGTAELFRSQ